MRRRTRIRLRVVGDRLGVTAEDDALQDWARDEVRIHKSAIVTILNGFELTEVNAGISEHDGGADPACARCGARDHSVYLTIAQDTVLCAPCWRGAR